MDPFPRNWTNRIIDLKHVTSIHEGKPEETMLGKHCHIPEVGVPLLLSLPHLHRRNNFSTIFVLLKALDFSFKFENL